jgi:hypothetical protein
MKQPRPSFLRRFAADTRGSILMIVGLVFLLLVGIAGAGYDLGMRELLRAHTQRAADFAATSAGGVEGSVTGMTDKQMREATALRYFNLNFGDSFLGEPRPALTPGTGMNSIDVSNGTITVQADGNIDTKFVRNLGPGNDTLAADGYSKALISSRSVDVDLVVVVDESGSQLNCIAHGPLAGSTPGTNQACASGPGSRMEAIHAALNTMVDDLMPSGSTNTHVRMGFLGYSAHVSNKWGLSSDRQQVLNVIPTLRGIFGGANFEHYGIYAAKDMLNGGTPGTPNATSTGSNLAHVITPNFAAPPARTARSDGQPFSPQKIVLLLNDGGIMFNPSRTGFWADMTYVNPLPIQNDPTQINTYCPTSPQDVTPCFAAMINACNAVKNMYGPNSVRIVFVNFIGALSITGGNNAASVAAMQACASINPITGQPDYMIAPTTADLNNFLAGLTQGIKKIRIVQ